MSFAPGSVVRFFVLLLLITPWLSVCSAADKAATEATVELDEVVVKGKVQKKIGPWEGLELEKEQIAGNVQSISSAEIKASFATGLGDLLGSRLQSVTVNDFQGNPFQMDINYRGFSASPQIGVAQGLSVFFDGIRVNEPFGDVVNWDLIPLNALSGVDVFPGSNPLFGLNTLGGALALRTKNGFDDAGANLRFLGGSWGRLRGEASVGWHKGRAGGFLAFTGFDEEGWRDHSPSQVKQGFGRFDWQGDAFSAKASFLMVGNRLLGNGLLPIDMYQQNPQAVFSSPDSTENNLQQYSLGGEWFVNNSLSVTSQFYHRASNRASLTGDIYQDFSEMKNDWSNPLQASGTRTGQPVCRYQDANDDGVPDYGLDRNFDGVADAGSINAPLGRDDLNYLMRLPPLERNCDLVNYQPVSPDSGPRNGAAGDPLNRRPGLSPSGWVDGTPIGVLTNSAIGQASTGANVQLNWHGGRHKFMLGAAVDAADTDFSTRQQLGLIDASRRVFLAPEQLDPLFVAGQQAIQNNTFDGQSITSSGYFSETFSPQDNVHLSFSGRFNHTQVQSNLRTRTRAGFENLHGIQDLNQYRPTVIVCPGTDPAACPATPNYNLLANWEKDVVLSQDPFYGFGNYSESPTSDRFIFQSFNPSVGVSYLPFKALTGNLKRLNPFFNWSQGTRVPSNVELGCAFDGRLVDQDPGNPNSPQVPKSFASIGGGCALPTLSGDPFLPQIVANTYEIGLRGTVLANWDWNIGVYRTDLNDDIYLVGITPDRSFFDTIGDTRRQGIELGVSGKTRFVDFHVNYGLNEATFQSRLFMVSAHNSSAAVATPLEPQYDASGRPLEAIQDMIQIDPGDRMPGMPLHTVNATVNFHLTQTWDFGVEMLARTDSFVRGNENNDHVQGSYEYIQRPNRTGTAMELIRVGRFDDAGSVPGYVLFNLRTRYELFPGMSFFGLINNVFDEQYASAGRLGINPYASSQQGVVGPSGWNYNSRDWQNTTLVGPGAPRAYWAGVEYRFDL